MTEKIRATNELKADRRKKGTGRGESHRCRQRKFHSADWDEKTEMIGEKRAQHGVLQVRLSPRKKDIEAL